MPNGLPPVPFRGAEGPACLASRVPPSRGAKTRHGIGHGAKLRAGADRSGRNSRQDGGDSRRGCPRREPMDGRTRAGGLLTPAHARCVRHLAAAGGLRSLPAPSLAPPPRFSLGALSGARIPDPKYCRTDSRSLRSLRLGYASRRATMPGFTGIALAPDIRVFARPIWPPAGAETRTTNVLKRSSGIKVPVAKPNVKDIRTGEPNRNTPRPSSRHSA
jgi:hypothetical protein